MRLPSSGAEPYIYFDKLARFGDLEKTAVLMVDGSPKPYDINGLEALKAAHQDPLVIKEIDSAINMLNQLHPSDFPEYNTPAANAVATL